MLSYSNVDFINICLIITYCEPLMQRLTLWFVVAVGL